MPDGAKVLWWRCGGIRCREWIAPIAGDLTDRITPSAASEAEVLVTIYEGRSCYTRLVPESAAELHGWAKVKL
jgi:hypothetical protein